VFDVIAAIDLRGGQVVRLREGDFERQIDYDHDPVDAALSFVEAGVRWIHVVDLDGARTGVPEQRETIHRIVAAVGDRASCEVAGGLRTFESVDAAFEAGAARVVVGTAALRDPGFAKKLVERHGTERIVGALDVRNGRALGEAWRPGASGLDAPEALAMLADAGVTLFAATAIDRDGSLAGPDLHLLESLLRLGRGGVIASGGVTTIDDLRAVRELGCSGAIVGRALYEGTLDLAEAITALG
jgi:phosphoribosylformimino-5-aminoimidazole carboxamide ribotide isomerase